MPNGRQLLQNLAAHFPELKTDKTLNSKGLPSADRENKMCSTNVQRKKTGLLGRHRNLSPAPKNIVPSTGTGHL